MYNVTGIKLNKNKLSKNKIIIDAGLPEEVNVPLCKFIGVPALPVVKKGDLVKVGSLIAKKTDDLSVNVYSSVSGQVIYINDKSISIKVIGDDYERKIDKSLDIVSAIPENADEILQKIKDFGIVGMGGAGFPTGIKLDIPENKQIKCLVINGLEGEPYFCGDNRLMVEKAEEIVIGARLINKVLGIQNAIIAIDEDNKEAVNILTSVTKRYVGVNVKAIKNKYPTAAETMLIKTLFGTEISKGKLPRDYGYVVQNVGTIYAVYNAVMKNMPLYQRVVSVSGDMVENPQNLMVRAGTPVSHLLKKVGVDIDKAQMLVLDGVMMGETIQNLDTPVSLLDGGLLVFKNPKPYTEATPCIRCNGCSKNCPVGLQPFAVANALKSGDKTKFYSLRVSDCLSCGICSYVCPAKIPLLDFIKMAKKEIR